MLSSPITLLIFLIYLGFTIFIGATQARQVKTAKDYTVTKMSAFRAAAFLTGFTMGGGSTYGMAGDTIKFGFTYLVWFPLSVTLGWILTGLLFAKPYFRLGGVTLPTLLAKRFDDKTRLATSISTMVYAFFTLLMEIFALAMVILSIFPGMSTEQAVFASFIVSTASVAFSGMMGSSRVNLMHTIVVLVSFSITLFILWTTVGGWGTAINHVIANLSSIADQDMTSRTWLSITGMGYGIVGQLLLGKSGRLGGISVVSNLAASCKNEKESLKAFIFAGVMSGITPLLAGLVGIFTAGKLGSRIIDSPIYSSIGLAVVDISPVLAGLLLAAVAAAILSTHGPISIVFSSVLIEDILKPIFHVNEKTERLLYPASIILVSAFSALYVATHGIKDLLPFIYSTAFPCTVPPTLVALFGIYSKRVSNQAAFWAIAISVPAALAWELVLDAPFGIQNIYIAFGLSGGILLTDLIRTWISTKLIILKEKSRTKSSF